MEIKVKSYSTQSSLISSIIFFILGGILFTSADKVISFLSIAIGIILATTGIVFLVLYFISIKKLEQNKKYLINGIVTLIVSIIFIFFSGVIEQFIRFIVGGWILFSGIIRLVNVLSMNNKNTKFFPLLIVSILLIIVGIYTIVIGNIILSSVGLIMMIYAGIEIIGYIFYSKDKQEKEETGATSLIIPEKTEEKTKKKKENIKDVEENKKDSEQ